ncbi:MAG: DUF4270 domain-containing protein [Odoribacteraceae bacterium]|jgi:hypothetical protein|nr:DUF4270 domain-containing protein [Odoribacteraceae bacterium]
MRISPLLIVTFFSLYACENEISEIGKRFEDNTRFVEVKRFEIEESSTIRLDSFPTSVGQGVVNDTVMVIGKTEDQTTGTMTSSAYFEVLPSSIPSVDFSESYVYDSLTLVVRSARTIAGDTTAMQLFHLYRLKEIPYFNEQWPYFNNVDSVPLGDHVGSMQMFPQKDHLLNTYFKLDDEWGREIYSLFARREDMLTDVWTFLDFFKGLAIVPDEDNSVLFSVNSRFELRCYYHLSSQGDVPQYIALGNKSNTGIAFFSFSRHKHEPAPDLKDATERSPLPFVIHNYGVIQGLNGYMMKLEVPYIQEYSRYRTIVKAQIAIKPRLENFENIPEPTRLYIYECDELGTPQRVLSEGYSDPTTLMGNERFIFDITDFYKNRVQKNPDARPINLLIGLPGFVISGIDQVRFIGGNVNTSFERMIVREIPELYIHYIQFK